MSWPGGQYAANGQADPNLLRQQLQQLQQSLTPPVSGGTAPAPFSTAMPQTHTQPASAPAAMDNAMQMLLARAMSIPLATVLFQSLMGTQQPAAAPVFQSPAVMQPASQTLPAGPPQSALLQPALLQMMQQGFHTASSSAVASQPYTTVPPAPPALPPAPPAAQHVPTPPPPARSSTSPSIQLPPMEPSVAKEMLVQLVQQLQQAGQLPYDDTIQRLLQPNAEPSQFQTTRVEVKKENEATQQLPGQSPMCVISKTESFDMKPAPEVYMDVAEDVNSVSTASTQGDVRRDVESDADEGEGAAVETRSHSARATKNKQTVVQRGERSRQQDASHTQQKSPRTSSRSAAELTDPKLQKKCIVKLDKVDTAKKPLSIPSPQLSRVDKLKNMKKYSVSTDILHSSEPGKPVAAGSSKLLADCKSDVQPMMPVNQQSTTSSARVGTKNIFSIFAQHMTGRGVQQEEPPAEVRPSDPLPASIGVLLQRSVNSVQNKTLSLRSMYLGYASHNMEWLSLVSSMFGTFRKTVCQCSFCPKVGEFPRDVAVHISREHQDLLFALNKLKPLIGPLMYIKCRHCNYVTVESTLAWIHYDIHHGISDILDCSERATNIDMSGPDMPATFIGIDDTMGSTTAYVCFDCSAVNVDPDTKESSLLMARHVARQHPNSVNCNGNFVKLMMLTRAEGDPDSIKGSPTYRQAICDMEHARGRREVYICMFCR